MSREHENNKCVKCLFKMVPLRKSRFKGHYQYLICDKFVSQISLVLRFTPMKTLELLIIFHNSFQEQTDFFNLNVSMRH